MEDPMEVDGANEGEAPSQSDSRMMEEGVSEGGELVADEPLPSEKVAAVPGPVYRRKLKKLAAAGGEKAPPEKREEGSGKIEPMEKQGLEKAETLKKRKAGFQKRDKQQEEVELVRKEGEFEIGDLVWTKLKGHPWWPSQVFDPEKASKKAKKLQKPDHLLIAFFGDDTFAWHKLEDLIPFEANLEVKSKQSGGGKLFQEAIEAAQEELERQKAAARGEVVEDPEEREKRLRKERAEAEKAAIAAFDPEGVLAYIRELAVEPLESPEKEPARIQALAYRSVIHHEEKEHPAKAGILPGWRPIPKESPTTKEPKRKPKPELVEESDEDVPILKTPKPPRTPKADEATSEKRKRGWPKGKPRGKKDPLEGDDGSEKKRRRKKVKETEGVSPSAKFDQLVAAAIDNIEGGGEDEMEGKDEPNSEEPGYFTMAYVEGGERLAAPKSEGSLKEEEDGLAEPEERKVKKEVRIAVPKVKRATREEAGEELGELLDKLRIIAQDPLATDPDSDDFQKTSTNYISYRRYQIARAKARYQRSYNQSLGISPRPAHPPGDKRKAPQNVARVSAELRTPKKPKVPPPEKDEEKAQEVVEKPKVKRVRKRKETEGGERKERVRKEGGGKKEEEPKGEQREGDEDSSDEDVPLQKRMKIFADTALPPRKQVGTATAADRIAENRRRMLGARAAAEKGGVSPKASEPSGKASEKGSEAPPKPFEPLALFMRFPERFAVPSESQLKANFVRFGELASYKGATRVLAHRSSAQVVFKRSEDAESAFRYCRNNTMFGNDKIRYELREVVFQETLNKKGRANGTANDEQLRRNSAMGYGELLKGSMTKPGPSPPPYRPIQSRPGLQGTGGSGPPASSGGPAQSAKPPARSILKDPRRTSQVRQSLLLSSAMETLLKPPPVRPPPPQGAPVPPYGTSQTPSSNFPIPPPPPPYTGTGRPNLPPQQPSYTGQQSAYAGGQSTPYASQPTGAASSYGPRPPAYGPNQSQPPVYAVRGPPQPPPGRPPFNHTPSHDPNRPGYANQLNHPPAPQPPLPPYPRGQQPPAPAYGRPSSVYTAVFGSQQLRPGGVAAGQTLPPPPPPMPAPPQQLASDVQKLADLLQVFNNAQNVQNPHPAQTLAPPPPPLPPQNPPPQTGSGNPRVPAAQLNQAGGGGGEPDSKVMHRERIGELIGGAGAPEDDSFRDMLEQLLTQAAELTQGTEL